MPTNRRGFTLVEVVIVIVVVGILASITSSGLTRFRQRAQNEVAQRYVEAYAVAARAIAMQRGRSASLNIAGDSIWVTADSAGVDLLLRPAVRLRQEFRVTAAGPAQVTFDPRGFASGAPAVGARVVVQPTLNGSIHAVSDTVCVSRTGRVLSQGC
jgi:prepilin-type N-terminal cleavage/methylation domain-containing protein